MHGRYAPPWAGGCRLKPAFQVVLLFMETRIRRGAPASCGENATPPDDGDGEERRSSDRHRPRSGRNSWASVSPDDAPVKGNGATTTARAYSAFAVFVSGPRNGARQHREFRGLRPRCRSEDRRSSLLAPRRFHARRGAQEGTRMGVSPGGGLRPARGPKGRRRRVPVCPTGRRDKHIPSVPVGSEGENHLADRRHDVRGAEHRACRLKPAFPGVAGSALFAGAVEAADRLFQDAWEGGVADCLEGGERYLAVAARLRHEGEVEADRRHVEG